MNIKHLFSAAKTADPTLGQLLKTSADLWPHLSEEDRKARLQTRLGTLEARGNLIREGTGITARYRLVASSPTTATTDINND